MGDITVDMLSDIANIIIKSAAVITAVGVILGVITALYGRVTEQKRKNSLYENQIKSIKEENTLIVFALSACLDGLEQLGANHTVPLAKDRLDRYINKQAHR